MTTTRRRAPAAFAAPAADRRAPHLRCRSATPFPGLQWQGRGVTPEHLRPRYAAHLAPATQEMAGRSRAALDGRPVGAGRVGVAPTRTSVPPSH
ncbi:hypothetical protein [Streptomyces sp. NPDC059649]|uniref:hypothetical protein n=1 Tax=Streptomyces sp. NPDC059649 TaxID=3346895 RepID=UPI00367C903D